MTEQSRREFLRKLARGSVYAAPLVSTLLAPRSANGQARPSQMMMMMMMMEMLPMNFMRAGARPQHLPSAPWFKRPPGR